MRNFTVGLLGLLLCSSAFAADHLAGNKYFEITQPPAVTAELDLQAWTEHDVAPPAPAEKYVRNHHFGVWIDPASEPTCLTTRGLVLRRETKAPIAVFPADPCYVEKGDWVDPYTGKEFTDAKLVQIDHMVPLKAAYLAGAYDWPWKKRCAYTNFMGNSYHLIPIEGVINAKKSDMSPDQWLPPNTAYHCQYVANWLHVKAIWQLKIAEAEAQGIKRIIHDENCDPALFKMSGDELSQQQAKITEFANQCPDVPPAIVPVVH